MNKYVMNVWIRKNLIRKLLSHFLASPLYVISFWACLMLGWWALVFTVGFFPTIMWSLIISSIIGIYILLKDGYR